MPVLRAEPLSWASSGVRILCGEEELTQLHVTPFRAKGSFELDGESYAIEPKGFFGSDAVLKRGSTVVARVKKEGALRRRFAITSAGHRLILVSSTWSGREYTLLVGNQETGRVKREGFAGRRMILDFPDEVPVVLQVFLTYVVAAQTRREAAAAAGG